jgi:hypothetical protein
MSASCEMIELSSRSEAKPTPRNGCVYFTPRDFSIANSANVARKSLGIDRGMSKTRCIGTRSPSNARIKIARADCRDRDGSTKPQTVTFAQAERAIGGARAAPVTIYTKANGPEDLLDPGRQIDAA